MCWIKHAAVDLSQTILSNPNRLHTIKIMFKWIGLWVVFNQRFNSHWLKSITVNGELQCNTNAQNLDCKRPIEAFIGHINVCPSLWHSLSLWLTMTLTTNTGQLVQHDGCQYLWTTNVTDYGKLIISGSSKNPHLVISLISDKGIRRKNLIKSVILI